MYYILCGLLSLAVGIVVGILWTKRNYSGTIRVDQSEPDEAPMLFLELEENVYKLKRRKRAIFRVEMKNYY